MSQNRVRPLKQEEAMAECGVPDRFLLAACHVLDVAGVSLLSGSSAQS